MGNGWPSVVQSRSAAGLQRNNDIDNNIWSHGSLFKVPIV